MLFFTILLKLLTGTLQNRTLNFLPCNMTFNHQVPIMIAFDMIILITVSIYGAFHILRFRFKSDKNQSNNSTCLKWINLKTTSYMIIIAAITVRLVSLLLSIPGIYRSNHFFNDQACKYFILIQIEISIILKFLTHLFVLLRSRITGHDEKLSIWYILGIFLVMTDALFILYPLSGIPRFSATYNTEKYCVSDADTSIFIWFGASDLIIGLYFLIVFIYPLRKYIKLEQQSQNENAAVYKERMSLSQIATRIMIYSSIMLITTIICTMIAAIYNQSAGIVMPIDGLINLICIVMQFRPIQPSQIPKKYLCFITCLQCQYKIGSKKHEENISMMIGGLRVRAMTSSTFTANETKEATQESQDNKPTLKQELSLSLIKDDCKGPKIDVSIQ